MSALWAPVPDDVPAHDEERTASRPALRAIPGAFPRLARVPFILVLIGIFGLGMTGLLMLNTTLQNQAFQASDLNRQATELAYTRADLESQLDQQAAPQILAQRASAYGLRANLYPAYLVLPQGRVVGTPRAVKGDELPSTIVKTPVQLAAERAAAAVRKQAKALQAAADARAKVLAARQAAVAKQAEAQQAAEAKKTAANSSKSTAKKSTAKKTPGKKTPGKNTTAKKSAPKRTGARG